MSRHEEASLPAWTRMRCSVFAISWSCLLEAASTLLFYHASAPNRFIAMDTPAGNPQPSFQSSTSENPAVSPLSLRENKLCPFSWMHCKHGLPQLSLQRAPACKALQVCQLSPSPATETDSRVAR